MLPSFQGRGGGGSGRDVNYPPQEGAHKHSSEIRRSELQSAVIPSSRNTIRVTGDGVFTDLVILPASFNASNDIHIEGVKVKVRVTSAVNNGSGDWRVTSADHGLVTNDKIAISGARGTSGFDGLNCTTYGQLRTVTKIDDNTFDVNDTTVTGTHTSNTGWWGGWVK